MRIADTPEMAKLWKNIEPYLDEHCQLRKDAPEQIKKYDEEYHRLSKEQWDFAYSLM